MFTTYFWSEIKNIFLHQNDFSLLNLSKQKSCENCLFFFFTVYMVRSAVVGGNFMPIGEYVRTAKNRRKRASVYRRVGVKGLIRLKTRILLYFPSMTNFLDTFIRGTDSVFQEERFLAKKN